MLNELSTSLADEFKRKYGVAKPASDCFQEDAELKELMAKIAKLSKRHGDVPTTLKLLCRVRFSSLCETPTRYWGSGTRDNSCIKGN